MELEMSLQVRQLYQNVSRWDYKSKGFIKEKEIGLKANQTKEKKRELCRVSNL